MTYKAMLFVSVLLVTASPAVAQCWLEHCNAEERELERQRDIEHQHNLDMRQMELQNHQMMTDDPLEKAIDQNYLDGINQERETRELELKIQQERLKRQREQPLQDYVNTHNIDGTPRAKP